MRIAATAPSSGGSVRHRPDAAEAAVPGAYARALADPAFRARYLAAYDGEAAPLDALWWLDHPGEAAPSGAEAPAATARRERRSVYAAGAGDREREAAAEAERRAEAVRIAAAEAVRRAEGALAAPAGPATAPLRRVRRAVRALPPLIGVAAAALVATALAAAPPRHVDRPDIARALQAVFPRAAPRQADVLVALSGSGSERLSRWAAGTAPQRLTTLLCRGNGRIELRYSDQRSAATRMSCTAGSARLTRVLDTMPRDGFEATVAVWGTVGWSLTVANEQVRYDAQTYPPCVGVQC